MMGHPVVVDASVGVKWFRVEGASSQAWELLERHAEGEVDIHVPTQRMGEILAVVARSSGTSGAIRAWVALDMARLEQHGFSDALLHEARRQTDALGCVFYDALVPALAVLLGADLYSGDKGAHGAFPGVKLLFDDRGSISN
jgi:predicted nucleic acid-binding protein